MPEGSNEVVEVARDLPTDWGFVHIVHAISTTIT